MHSVCTNEEYSIAIKNVARTPRPVRINSGRGSQGLMEQVMRRLEAIYSNVWLGPIQLPPDSLTVFGPGSRSNPPFERHNLRDKQSHGRLNRTKISGMESDQIDILGETEANVCELRSSRARCAEETPFPNTTIRRNRRKALIHGCQVCNSVMRMCVWVRLLVEQQRMDVK